MFADLPEAELQTLALQALTRIFPKNSIVLNEGDRTNSLYVILAGRVKVYCADEEGREIVLETLADVITSVVATAYQAGVSVFEYLPGCAPALCRRGQGSARVLAAVELSNHPRG